MIKLQSTQTTTNAERSERMKNHRKKPTKKATTDNDADNSDHDTQKRKRNPGEMVEDGEEMEAHVPMEGREVLDEQAQGIEVVDALTNQVKMQGECVCVVGMFFFLYPEHPSLVGCSSCFHQDHPVVEKLS